MASHLPLGWQNQNMLHKAAYSWAYVGLKYTRTAEPNTWASESRILGTETVRVTDKFWHRRVSVIHKGESETKGANTMKCNEIMTKDPMCCLPGDTVDQAAQLMKDEDVGPVPVVADQTTKRLLGIVTDRDLAVKVVAEARQIAAVKVEEVMTRDPVTCHVDDDLQKAIDAMEKHQVRRIPVVDDNNQIVGIIAQADIAIRAHKPETTAEVVEEISKSATAE